MEFGFNSITITCPIRFIMARALLSSVSNNFFFFHQPRGVDCLTASWSEVWSNKLSACELSWYFENAFNDVFVEIGIIGKCTSRLSMQLCLINACCWVYKAQRWLVRISLQKVCSEEQFRNTWLNMKTQLVESCVEVLNSPVSYIWCVMWKCSHGVPVDVPTVYFVRMSVATQSP